MYVLIIHMYICINYSYHLPSLLLLPCECWWWCCCGCWCCIWGINAGWGNWSNFGSSLLAAATGIGPALVIVVIVAAGIMSVDIVSILALTLWPNTYTNIITGRLGTTDFLRLCFGSLRFVFVCKYLFIFSLFYFT